MTSQKLTDILNFVEFNSTLGTAGQPKPEQFAAVADAGYTIVVNLAMPDSRRGLKDEGQYVEACGLTYINIPVVWGHPTMRDLQRFFTVMDAHPDEKVFLHCIVNHRASAFAFLYSVLKLGKPVEEARTMMQRIWKPYGVWQRFVKTALAS